MKRAFYILPFLLFVLSLLTGFTTGEDSQTVDLTSAEQQWLDKEYVVKIHVGMYHPYIFVDGDVRGITIDYLKPILEKYNIQYEYVYNKDVLWADAHQSICRDSSPAVDLFPMVNETENRQKCMNFTDIFLNIPRVIISRKDSPFIADLNDLTGKTVAVQKGFITQELIRDLYPQVKLLVIPDSDTRKTLEAVSIGKADAAVCSLGTATYIIHSEWFQDLKVAAPSGLPDYNFKMGVRKDWPELASILNKGLGKLTREDRQEIVNHWLAVRVEHGINWIHIAAWTIVVLLVASIFVGFFSISNRRLNQEIIKRMKTEKELRTALDEVKTLQKLLPVCAACRKVRNDEGYWTTLENYLETAADVQVSHSLCEDCIKALYPEYTDEEDSKNSD